MKSSVCVVNDFCISYFTKINRKLVSYAEVSLYQKEAVTDKIQARQLLVGIYSEEDVLISDMHEQTFDLTSENSRERELKLRLVLSREAESCNNQEVFLKLKEEISGTSHDKTYQSLSYQMHRSFTTDFDF